MTYLKWLIATLSLILIFALIVVAVNFCVDHHAVRLSLFSGKGTIQQTAYPDGINQHIFNPEVIFRNPEKFDSLLFGSSRSAQIDVAGISSGKFYNMSYSLGLPGQHLAILKALLKRGVKINTVVIGLDEISFSPPAVALEKHLIRIMHPDAGGPGRLAIFDTYFFRKPDLKELSRWKQRVLMGKTKGMFIISSQGVNLGWRDKDQMIDQTGKPVFNYTVNRYEPRTYPQKDMDDAFAILEELKTLSQAHQFKLIFFITPFYAQQYINQAESMLIVKERLAKLTDYYDFSGFNTVTTDPTNYFDENSHYRYHVGDMIIARIFRAVPPQDDFGVLVTRENIKSNLEKQKIELRQYLKSNRLQ